jgi:nucleotidyltransferase substrate binding protein (TIGR01987 family)
MGQDIRWQQRFSNFLSALSALTEAVVLSRERSLSNLEQQGLIQAFEFTHELAWKVLKDYLEYQGIVDVVGSRDASRLAFQNSLIEDGDAWMKMIEARNLTSHTYNLSVAQAVVESILVRFYPAFLLLAIRFERLKNNSE